MSPMDKSLTKFWLCTIQREACMFLHLKCQASIQPPELSFVQPLWLPNLTQFVSQVQELECETPITRTGRYPWEKLLNMHVYSWILHTSPLTTLHEHSLKYVRVHENCMNDNEHQMRHFVSLFDMWHLDLQGYYLTVRLFNIWLRSSELPSAGICIVP